MLTEETEILLDKAAYDKAYNKLISEYTKTLSTLIKKPLDGEFISEASIDGLIKDSKTQRYITVKCYPCKIIEKIRSDRVAGNIDGKLTGNSSSFGSSYSSGFGYGGIGAFGGSGYYSGTGYVDGKLKGNLDTDTHFIFVLDINNGMKFDELEISADEYYRYNKDDIIYCNRYTYEQTERPYTDTEKLEEEEKAEKLHQDLENLKKVYEEKAEKRRQAKQAKVINTAEQKKARIIWTVIGVSVITVAVIVAMILGLR